MAFLVKLAVISKSGKASSFLQKLVVFLHLLYTLVEKWSYLVSTTSYQFSVTAFCCSYASDSNGVHKNHIGLNGV